MAVVSSEMKEAQKQDATDIKDEQPPAEVKTDAKSSDSENKDGVTKMDTIPASAAVTTTEPSGDH